MVGPLGELFREGTLLAIREIFETEVLVDLQKGLMLPGVRQVRFGFREGTEEAFAASLHLLIGSGGSESKEGSGIVQVQGVKGIDEKLFEA